MGQRGRRVRGPEPDAIRVLRAALKGAPHFSEQVRARAGRGRGRGRRRGSRGGALPPPLGHDDGATLEREELFLR